MGVLGIVRSKFNGINHYLLNAKIEPGNTLQFQISPTLQATYSNLKRAHGGKKPKFSEFFAEESGPHVVYKQWLAEDGGRFYLKSNLNMLIEIEPEELGEIPDDFRWFTLSQIKEMLLKDNYINPHVRSILCHI
jgi:oxidase EvaA